MSLPPVTESQSVSTPLVDVPLPTITSVAHTTSYSPVPPTRDPELVAASEALCLLHEAPKLLNGTSFNNLERHRSQFSRSRYYSTSNNSQMVRDRAIVTMAD